MGVAYGNNTRVINSTDAGRIVASTRMVVQDGLVLNLDAGASTSYPGIGTAWTDLSGNGNTGTLENGVGFDSGNGGSLSFDGSNEYISFNNNLTTSSLGLTSSSGATLSCWLKITLRSTWTGVFVFWKTNVGADFGWDITGSNNLRIWKNGITQTISSLSSYSNLWSNYVLVSNSSGTIFYINGNQFDTTFLSGNIQSYGGRNLMFGDHWDSPIQGNTSSISIYNRALTATEIQQNFNALRGRFGI